MSAIDEFERRFRAAAALIPVVQDHAGAEFHVLYKGGPMTFSDMVKAELTQARIKYPGVQHSVHEGFSVLYEEVDELWDEVRRKQADRNHAAMLKELVQIAAMAQRMAEDVVVPKIEALQA